MGEVGRRELIISHPFGHFISNTMLLSTIHEEHVPHIDQKRKLHGILHLIALNDPYYHIRSATACTAILEPHIPSPIAHPAASLRNTVGSESRSLPLCTGPLAPGVWRSDPAAGCRLRNAEPIRANPPRVTVSTACGFGRICHLSHVD